MAKPPERPKPPVAGFQKGSVRKVYSIRETQEQTAFVEQMLVSRVPKPRIFKEGRERHGMTTSRVSTLIRRIEDRWKVEDQDRRAEWKSAAIRGLQEDMLRCRQELQATPDKKHATLLRYHALLADIQGVREPLKVDVDVRVSQSVTGVIANLTPDQVSQYLSRYQENVRLAEEYRRRLGGGTPGSRLDEDDAAE